MSNQMQWTKFYWADWVRDPALRLCGYAAKGLWMDMLCQMDASEERGVLVIAGRAATTAEIARMVGGERRTVERLLAELEANGVFSRDSKGAIFSRRMTRNCDKSRINAENGRRGGNPVLLKNNHLSEKSVKPRVKAETETETETENPPIVPQLPTVAIAPVNDKLAGSLFPEHRPPPRKATPPKPRDSDPDWVAFYAAYPRKEAPAKAFEAWKKAIMGGATATQIMAALKRYRFSDDEKYIPHPATWLNSGNWKIQPIKPNQRDAWEAPSISGTW